MQIEHLNKETTDGTVRNLDALYQLFPSEHSGNTAGLSRCVLNVFLREVKGIKV